jgi:tripartite-type tricarboxylate transporter receptor subunit TctC
MKAWKLALIASSCALTGFASLSICACARADAGYPVKPIRMLVGYSPGGAVDVTARVISDHLAASLGKPVLVDNRVGASGNIAAEMLAKSAPDGYTLYMGTSINAVSVSLFKQLRYHPLRDFAPISLAVTTPSILVVNPTVPAHTVNELVELARRTPDRLTYATTGVGSSAHLGVALLASLTGIRMIHVPYKGGAQTIVDLVGGQVDLSFANTLGAMPHVQTKRLRALAVTGRNRFSQAPGVPTMIESGFPNFVQVAWYGVMAPAGTPAEIINRLSGEIGRILRIEDVRDTLARQGVDAQPSSPQELAALLKADIAKYAGILKKAGIAPE